MTLVDLNLMENGTFLNKELRNCSNSMGQMIIVDSGCPQSLMGEEELKKLKDLIEVIEINVRDEGFRFGPSRIYKSNRKVIFKMKIGIHEIEAAFFVLDGDVPILLGNDVMVPLGGNIDMEDLEYYECLDDI